MKVPASAVCVLAVYVCVCACVAAAEGLGSEPAVTLATGDDFRSGVFTKPLEADTVIAFISPKCPYCKRLEPVFDVVAEDYASKKSVATTEHKDNTRANQEHDHDEQLRHAEGVRDGKMSINKENRQPRQMHRVENVAALSKPTAEPSYTTVSEGLASLIQVQEKEGESGEPVNFYRVDAKNDQSLRDAFQVELFPSIRFFSKGAVIGNGETHGVEYNSAVERTKDNIESWIRTVREETSGVAADAHRFKQLTDKEVAAMHANSCTD